jgi:TetR/AcrR family transcriptional regulator
MPNTRKSKEKVIRQPQSTKAGILRAAREEFAQKGLEGARVDRIAERSGSNKRMIYHYFENKDGLYKTVLEGIYAELREHEAELNLERHSPIDAINLLVEHTFYYFHKNIEAVRLLNDENLHDARHVESSKSIAGLRLTLLDTISETLDRGVAAGLFRKDINPAHFYITVASVCYFPISNAATLKAFLGVDIQSKKDLELRLDYAKRAALGCLLRDPE